MGTLSGGWSQSRTSAESIIDHLILVQLQAKQHVPSMPRLQRQYDPVPGLPNLPMPPNPTDYFNLQVADMTVMPAGVKLHQLPPGMIPGAPIPPMYASGQAYQGAGPSSSRGGAIPENIPPPPMDKGGIHYPSQDPSRLGAVKK